MNAPASNFVEGVDLAFKVIFGIGIFFFVGITTVMIYFIIRYRKKNHPKAIQVKDNYALEITWTVIPLLLVLLMFYFGYVGFLPQTRIPADAMPIKVVGKMWTWSFVYEGEKESPVLVVPVNKAIRLNLYSPDVIHSLYIPAFRIKQDIVPGKENAMWFIAGREGEYEILCTAYCGLRHSYMESKVKVVKEEEFNKWLNSVPSASSEPAGLAIIKKNACNGCHSLDGSKLVSASFKGLYGKTETVITGGKERQAVVDDEYLKTSIYEPEKDLVKGFPKGVMKSYKDLINEEELNKVIDYLKTLK
jgi:cytochrome c oxidase subunit II